MATTKELLGEYIDAEVELQIADTNEELLDAEAKVQGIAGLIRRKADGIDHFMLELSKREHLIDAEIEAIKGEIRRLQVRRKAVESTKKYLNGVLIPLIVEELGDDNGVYETNTARYKLYETFGPVVVTDEDSIPDDFKVMKYTESIDKKKARTHLTNGEKIPGFYIEKIKRIKRS